MEIGVQFPDKDNFSKSKKKTFIKTESSSEENKFGGEKISRKKDENARGIDNQTNISAISRLRFAVCHHTGDRSFSDQQRIFRSKHTFASKYKFNYQCKQFQTRKNFVDN